MLNKNRKKLIRIFTAASLVTLTACITIGSIIIGEKNLVSKKDSLSQDFNNTTLTQKNSKEEKDSDTNKEINKTIAIFGCDKGNLRTDVIFVVNFQSKKGLTNIISIPRDTKVVWDDNFREKVSQYKNAPYVSKINEMTVYSYHSSRKYEDNLRDFTIQEIEQILGLPIDNFISVDLDAFKQIVDTIGGVEMYVPQDMYYVDRQQGLYVDLKEGQQVLDGDKAEQLVRFRRYPEGDIARVRTQQLFVEAFLKKATSPSIITKIPSIINTVFDTVNTDITLSTVSEYLPYLKKISTENLKFHVLPGEARYEDGVSYFFFSPDETSQMVDQEIINPSVEANDVNKTTDMPKIDNNNLKDLEIEVLNGARISGIAGRYQSELLTKGFKNVTTGNYETVQESVIMIKDENLKEEVSKIFSQIRIEVNQNITADIRILLGKDASFKIE